MYNTDLPTRAELPTTGQLIRSTVIAVVIAGVLLVTTVLPAEYGIDPTGIGRVLGLTRMGEIKRSLAAEAIVPKAPPPAPAAPPPAATPAPAARQHTMTVVLKPGQAAEIKLTMRKDVSVNYEWTAQGGPVNFDTHGEPLNAPKGFYHGYGKGRDATRDAGVLQAAFDGTHGWFWRNRSGSDVTVTLKTSGDYTQIQRVP